MHRKLWDMNVMPFMNRKIANKDAYKGSKTLGRVRVKECWRDASTPPSTSIKNLMHSLCTISICSHAKAFNRTISHLTSNWLVVLADCPMK
jgi:hypothetical protein